MSDAEIKTIIQLQLQPFPPTTALTLKSQLQELEESFPEDVKEHLQLVPERNFPALETSVILILVKAGSDAALETYKKIVIPWLQQRCHVKEAPVKETGNEDGQQR